MAKKTKVGLKVPTLNEMARRYGTALSLKASETIDHGLWIPSSFHALNYLMGGGCPWGKIIEVSGQESSGKSLIAFDFARSVQKLGGQVIWVDAEQAWSNSWAITNGLNLEQVTLVTDTQVEVISDAMADLSIYWRSQLQANEPILIVIDSIAALDCADSINSKMADGKAEMGSRAKAIYKMFRIRNELLYKLGITQIYVNQVRTSLNTGFGADPTCLHYDTNIPFVDGTSMKIGDIVKHRINKEVWSLNETTQAFEPKPITGWVKKAPSYIWYRIKTTGPGSKNGVNGITCTRDHFVLTGRGWKSAQDILVGDTLVTKVESKLSSASSLMAGILVGDSSFRNRHNKVNTSSLKLKDSKNPEYVNHKTGLLRGLYEINKASEGETLFNPDVELGNLYKEVRNEFGLVPHLKVWEKLKPDWFSLAIWYMDDGHLSKNGTAMISFSEKRTKQADMIEFLKENFGLEATRANTRNLKLDHSNSSKLFGNIKTFIPQCMQYKLPLEYQGEFTERPNLNIYSKTLPLEVRVIEVSQITSGRTLSKPHKYDITVEGHHNFLAGNTNTGVVVHNTTPGGKALAFYASIRLMFFGGKILTIKNKGKDRKSGRYVTIRVLKNKVAPPRATISKAPMYFEAKFHEVGFDKYFGLEDVFYQEDLIDKTNGGVYRYKGETLARGEDKFKALIEKDSKLRNKLLQECGVNTLRATKANLKAQEFNLFPLGSDVEYESQLDDNDEDNEGQDL